MIDSHQILFENFPHCEEYSEESFLADYHELDVLNIDKYIQLEKAIHQLANEYSDDVIPRNIAWPVMRIFSHFMLTIKYHGKQKKQRGLNIKYNDKPIEVTDLDYFIAEFSNRFQEIFEGFFRGEMPNNPTDLEEHGIVI